MDAARARKLGGRIAQIVAEMLERRIKDPRLGFVTVTEARLTNDLREATVFYTVYGSAEEHAGTAAALASAVGVIRSEVGRQTGLRHTPSLEFRLDTVPDNARNIEELVARAREADAALAAVREGAELRRCRPVASRCHGRRPDGDDWRATPRAGASQLRWRIRQPAWATRLRPHRPAKMIISPKPRHPESAARDTRGRDCRAPAGPGRFRAGANPRRSAHRRTRPWLVPASLVLDHGRSRRHTRCGLAGCGLAGCGLAGCGPEAGRPAGRG